ncbi:hypothetical protein APY04_0589 [Hyphomicrobium sulfonivorans]|uniref:Uncharacterized protein n=1 Tax=Hyphomicrobium sulfonivorans TaxID=121290 RepID=A0A109BLE2_HYPSL|nr:hypothetical protein APY04_0589 [Hyphomicrobium sulfonivorans]
MFRYAPCARCAIIVGLCRIDQLASRWSSISVQSTCNDRIAQRCEKIRASAVVR